MGYAESSLALRIAPGEGVQSATEQLVSASAERCRLTSVGTARQGSALDLIYRVRLRQGCSPSAPVAELKALPGVESVELRGKSEPRLSLSVQTFTPAASAAMIASVS